MKTFREIVTEDFDPMAHEVLTSHGLTHYGAEDGKRLYMGHRVTAALHDDLVSSGWDVTRHYPDRFSQYSRAGTNIKVDHYGPVGPEGATEVRMWSGPVHEMAELEMSDLQHRVAKGNKQHVLVHMHPLHFLDLTTASRMPPSHFRKHAQEVEDYNDYTRKGETLNSPFLTVHKDGRVLGHEGRHRAAALLNDGETRMPVHIRIQHHYNSDIPYRDLGWEHVPDRLHNQYDRPVSIPKKELTLVKDRVASLKESRSDPEHSLTHEVMTSHGLVPDSMLGWFAPAHVNVDMDALHHDLVGAGWKHEKTDFNKSHMGYRVSQYTTATHTLNLNHSINSYGEHESTQASAWRTAK